MAPDIRIAGLAITTRKAWDGRHSWIGAVKSLIYSTRSTEAGVVLTFLGDELFLMSNVKGGGGTWL